MERGVIRALVLAGDHASALQHAHRLIDRAKNAVGHVSDKDLLRCRVAEAYLSLASVHQASAAEWEQVREAAQEAIVLVRPLLTNLRWDPNVKLLRDAEVHRLGSAR